MFYVLFSYHLIDDVIDAEKREEVDNYDKEFSISSQLFSTSGLLSFGI